MVYETPMLMFIDNSDVIVRDTKAEEVRDIFTRSPRVNWICEINPHCGVPRISRTYKSRWS